MLPMNEQSWAKYVPMIEDTGATASSSTSAARTACRERGMGSAVGQVPEYIQQAAEWCKKYARVPVIVKLTPNITNILPAAKAAKDGGADAVSLINTLNSIMRVDYDTPDYLPGDRRQGLARRLLRSGRQADRAAHGRGDRALARDARACRSPASAASPTGATRSTSSRSARRTVQVCTAAMVYGFKIIDDLVDGLGNYLDSKGFASVRELVGKAVPSVTDWQYLNLNHVDKAWIDQDLCIKCGRCHIVCEDTSHQAITAYRERRAALRGDRRRVRRLQSVRQRLPGGRLHHDAPDDERRRSAHRPPDHQRESRLDHAPEQPGTAAGLRTARAVDYAVSSPARKLDIREANEARILRAAEKTFALHGFRGATTEGIASEAGLPKANVHYYFKTKANLYRQVLKGILEDWMEAAAAFEADEDPERALTMYITAKMQFSRQRPYGSRVWASEIMRGAPVMERFLGTTLKAWVNARVRTIRSWISAGKIRAVDPESLLYMIWAVTQHYADFERQIAILNGGDEFDERQYREKVEQVVRLILGSVGLEAAETVRTRETASA